MELSQLPQEMVAAIADHLEARDVMACSSVSVGWRRAFNLDRIWRNFCSLSPDYFQDDANKVKPSFETPYIEDSRLEPLCEWKVTFLKELYIKKNWELGRFSSEEVKLETNNCVYMMDAIDRFQNHWMFLCGTMKEGLKLQVWNIKGDPFLHMSKNMCTIFKNVEETVQNNVVNFKLHLSEEKLLFIYDNLVTVCDFSFPHYQLNFLYNFSFVHTAPFFTPRRIPHVPEGSLCDVEVIGSTLFGVCYSPSDVAQQFSPSVHVWDIGTAVKVKDHCVFEARERNSCPVLNNLFLTSGESDNLVITQTFDGVVAMSTRLRVFNRNTCEFTNFYVQLKFPVIWTAIAGNVLVVCELVNPLERDCVFHFYEVISTLYIFKSNTYNIYDPEKISSSHSKFAFIDLNGNITVYDIPTHQAVISSPQPSRNRLKTITLVTDSLLLLESKYRGTSRSFENVLVTSYEVWDFTKRTKPLRLEQCFRSMNRTKFTFERNFGVPPKLLTIVHPLYQPLTICVNSFW